MSGTLDIRIDQDVVKTVLNEKINEALSLAIVDKERVLDQMINKALNMKVDSDGKPSTYRDARSFMDWAATRAMQAAVKEGMDKAIQENQEEISRQVANQIAKSKNKLAKALVGGLAECLSCKWNSTVKITLAEPKEY